MDGTRLRRPEWAKCSAAPLNPIELCQWVSSRGQNRIPRTAHAQPFCAMTPNAAEKPRFREKSRFKQKSYGWFIQACRWCGRAALRGAPKLCGFVAKRRLARLRPKASGADTRHPRTKTEPGTLSAALRRAGHRRQATPPTTETSRSSLSFTAPPMRSRTRTRDHWRSRQCGGRRNSLLTRSKFPVWATIGSPIRSTTP